MIWGIQVKRKERCKYILLWLVACLPVTCLYALLYVTITDTDLGQENSWLIYTRNAQVSLSPNDQLIFPKKTDCEHQIFFPNTTLPLKFIKDQEGGVLSFTETSLAFWCISTVMRKQPQIEWRKEIIYTEMEIHLFRLQTFLQHDTASLLPSPVVDTS